MDKPERVARRVRHELKFRMLQVKRVVPMTPHLLRVTLGGDDLQGFASASYDDHVKVFFPEPGQDRPTLPRSGPNGPEFPEGQPRPTARDYTPRRFDAQALELDIEFALHGHGPAATWAANARPGAYLGVGGPRGSFVVDPDFAGYVFVGDETALPAIGRRLEELPAAANVRVIVEVAGPAEHLDLRAPANTRIEWVHRGSAEAGDPAALVAATTRASLPEGDVYAWVAAESAVAKAVRKVLIDDRGLNKTWVKAAGYWKRGAAASHDKLDD